MKNIHVLKTDKPSRLYYNSNQKHYRFNFNVIRSSSCIENQNIYITSDEEIKEGVNQWYLDKVLNKPRNSSGSQYGENQNVIILTTDQDLIKDGVQAIDDEFLEWFVKNPSCERVEVEIDYFMWREGTTKLDDFFKIIIPKEEPKQDLEKEMFELEQELDIPSHLRWHNSKPKQETLEKAAENDSEYLADWEDKTMYKRGFIEGAEWQQKQTYREKEENLLKMLHKFGFDYAYNYKGEKTIYEWIPEWFEEYKRVQQFKKK